MGCRYCESGWRRSWGRGWGRISSRGHRLGGSLRLECAPCLPPLTVIFARARVALVGLVALLLLLHGGNPTSSPTSLTPSSRSSFPSHCHPSFPSFLSCPPFPSFVRHHAFPTLLLHQTFPPLLPNHTFSSPPLHSSINPLRSFKFPTILPSHPFPLKMSTETPPIAPPPPFVGCLFARLVSQGRRER